MKKVWKFILILLFAGVYLYFYHVIEDKGNNTKHFVIFAAIVTLVGYLIVVNILKNRRE